MMQRGGLQKTANGRFEMSFMINCVTCHVILKSLLSAAPKAVPQRICVTSGGLHKNSGVHKEKLDFEDLQYEKSEFK